MNRKEANSDQKSPLYAVILAGGKGERFWPLSTPERPKPFLRFFSDRSLLQHTYARAALVAPRERIFLVVGEQHEKLAREQLPELEDSGLLLEPAGRDTAAAIGYASLHFPSDALMLVLPADHLIPEGALFAATVHSAAAFLSDHSGTLTFGIRPDRPETNYGYIRAAAANVGSAGLAVFAVEEFIEKPERTLAEEFLLHSSYYWNSGMFLWKVSHLQEMIARFLPDLWDGLGKAYAARGSAGFREMYSGLHKISIDYGVMQKADQVFVVPAPFQWDDIGTWNSLPRILPVDENQNLSRGTHVGMETFNCILYSENHTIVTAGIQDLIIVQSGDQILVCHKQFADRLKQLLAKLSS